MISKSYRVPRNRIEYILKKGETSHSDLFIKKFKENEEGVNRFSTIVSCKIDPKAVRRNKLRRQIYEAIRLNIPKTTKTFDSILIPKKRILQSSYQEIFDDIKTILTTSNGEI